MLTCESQRPFPLSADTVSVGGATRSESQEMWLGGGGGGGGGERGGGRLDNC